MAHNSMKTSYFVFCSPSPPEANTEVTSFARVAGSANLLVVCVLLPNTPWWVYGNLESQGCNNCGYNHKGTSHLFHSVPLIALVPWELAVPWYCSSMCCILSHSTCWQRPSLHFFFALSGALSVVGIQLKREQQWGWIFRDPSAKCKFGLGSTWFQCQKFAAPHGSNQGQ